jgi:hypothetical protein
MNILSVTVTLRVQCTVTSNRNKAYYFNETINSKCYVNLILGPFFQELRDKEKTYGYFMQVMQQLTQMNS